MADQHHPPSAEIAALLREDRQFPPTEDWKTRANAIDPSIYDRALDDPEGFLGSLGRKGAVVLDEVHRLQDPATVLKIAADRVPDHGGLTSTMTIVVPSPDPMMELFVDEIKVKSPSSGEIVLGGIGPESSGKMHPSTKIGSLSFTGSSGVSTTE